MKIYSVSLPGVTPIKLVTGKANCGIGCLTAFVGSLCSFFGVFNGLYTQKMQKAENIAMEELIANAHAIGADGVMDVRCQIDGLSCLVSGTAYKLSPEGKAKHNNVPSQKETKSTEAEKNTVRKTIAERTEDELFNEDGYIDVICPRCKERLSFLKDEANAVCPWCGERIQM